MIAQSQFSLFLLFMASLCGCVGVETPDQKPDPVLPVQVPEPVLPDQEPEPVLPDPEPEPVLPDPEPEPVFSPDRIIDERVEFSHAEVLLKEGLPQVAFVDITPATAPIAVSPGTDAESHVSVSESAAWEKFTTVLVLPGSEAYVGALSSPNLGNAIEAEIIRGGRFPVDRTQLHEMEREVWLSSFSGRTFESVYLIVQNVLSAAPLQTSEGLISAGVSEVLRDFVGSALAQLGRVQTPRLKNGWEPMIGMDETQLWVSVLHGDRGANNENPRAGRLSTPQLLLELDGPVFVSEPFEVVVPLVDGRVEGWFNSPPLHVVDWTLETVSSESDGVFGGSITQFNPSFMDPLSGAFWGPTGEYRESSGRIDEYMLHKYGHRFMRESVCPECSAHLKGDALSLPGDLKLSYEALQLVSGVGGGEDRAVTTRVIQDKIADLEESLRPQTPWQRLDSEIPTVPPVWKCADCGFLRHVEFLIGYRGPGVDPSGCELGAFRTHITWGAAPPKDGIYRIRRLDELSRARGYTTFEGVHTADSVVANFAAGSQRRVALVKGGRVTIFPRKRVEFVEGQSMCIVPATTPDGRQKYIPVGNWQSGTRTLPNRRASLGCRVLETESSRVLATMSLNMSYLDLLDQGVQISVQDGRLRAGDWPDPDEQDEALVLALAAQLLESLPAPR